MSQNRQAAPKSRSAGPMKGNAAMVEKERFPWKKTLKKPEGLL
jgi:hypothetical protein